MTCSFEFWDALAPHHSKIENSYFDLPSLRRIQHELQPPVLVVGAGQGLIVAELQKNGLQCDGVDLSPEMIRYAMIRRRLALVRADARALPFGDGTYKTIIYATGVVDFMSDEEDIKLIMNEARRLMDHAGKIFIAFYRISAASENFLIRLGLIRNSVLSHRESLEFHRLSPVQAISLVAKKAKVGFARAAILSLRSWAYSSWQEKRNGFHMQKIFAKGNCADILIQTAPETQPYRNEAEIRNLFTRLGIPIKQLGAFSSCYVVRI